MANVASLHSFSYLKNGVFIASEFILGSYVVNEGFCIYAPNLLDNRDGSKQNYSLHGVSLPFCECIHSENI